MDNFTIIAIALSLSFDTFAVSLSYGVVQNKILFRQALIVATVLALFQGGLTIIGYFMGSVITYALKSTDHWVALALLTFLGVRMIIEGKRKSDTRAESKYTGSKLLLLTIALGTSIDAFAVGISFAILYVQIWKAGILIGIVTFLSSMTAIRIGKSAGARLGNKVEIIGGLMLIAIGVKIFLDHVLSS